MENRRVSGKTAVSRISVVPRSSFEELELHNLRRRTLFRITLLVLPTVVYPFFLVTLCSIAPRSVWAAGSIATIRDLF